MMQIKINIPGLGEKDGDGPIVILGPNGSGKTKLAQKLAGSNQISAIGAQRRTWVDDNLPVQEKEQLKNNVKAQQDHWKQNSWRPTEEVNFLLSSLIQDHTNHLSTKNEEAIRINKPLEPVRDTNLIRLQGLWNRLFPKRKLEIGGYFPRVKRLDIPSTPTYKLREMSDGERTIMFMAARVLTAEHSIILVDEPELHMHSKLAVKFWDEAEKLRPDCRFIYVTHDLNFALSRRNAIYLVPQADEQIKELVVGELPTSVAAEVIGVATLPFYAKRVFLYEGEKGKGFASEFFSAWFDDDETFAIPAGDRDSVCAAYSGLRAVGISGAEIIGLVDRDFYSDDVLNAVTKGVTVLPLHEIESVLCDPKVVKSLAEHLGKNPTVTWTAFVDRVRGEYRGKTLNSVVARRVRARVGDLLEGVFYGSQIDHDLITTGQNHSTKLASLDLPVKVQSIFTEESSRVNDALHEGEKNMLAILPGKHLISMLPGILGLRDTSELTSLVIRALDRKQLKVDDPIKALGNKIETALLAYLPARNT